MTVYLWELITMPHANRVPLSQWPDGWIKLEIASITNRPEYVIMTAGEKRGANLPAEREESIMYLRNHYGIESTPWAPEPALKYDALTPDQMADADGCKPKPVDNEFTPPKPLEFIGPATTWWHALITDRLEKWRMQPDSDLQLAYEARKAHDALVTVLGSIAYQRQSSERKYDLGNTEVRLDDAIKAARLALGLKVRKPTGEVREERTLAATRYGIDLPELDARLAEKWRTRKRPSRTAWNGFESGNYYLHRHSGQVVFAKEFFHDGRVEVVLATGVTKDFRTAELEPGVRIPYAIAS